MFRCSWAAAICDGRPGSAGSYSAVASAPLQDMLLLNLLLWRIDAAASSVGQVEQRRIRFYGALQSPSEHPLYERRAVQPPQYSDFGKSGIGWMALRGFPTTPNGTLTQIEELLDQYTTGPDAVSSVLWPGISTVAAPNFPELVDALKRCC